MKKKLIRAALGIVFLGIALFNVDFNKIVTNLKNCDYLFLLSAAVASFCGLFVILWIRNQVLNVIAKTPYGVMIKAYFAANYINSITPANLGGLLGEPWGFYSFSKGMISFAQGLAFVILATTVQNIRRIILSIIGLILFYKMLPKEYISIILLAVLVYLSYTGVFLLAIFQNHIPSFFVKPFKAVLQKLSRGFVSKIFSARLKSLPENIRENFGLLITSKTVYAGLAALIITDVLLEGFRMWLLLLSFGVKFDFRLILIIPSLVYSVTVLPVSIGGLGVSELSGIVVLQIFGISPEIALSVIFLDRFLFSYWGIVFGWIFVPYMKIPRKEAVW